MAKNPNEPSEIQKTSFINTQRPSRRILVVAAGAFGTAAIWALRRFPIVAVEASGSGGSPGSVTIVQFSDLGKPTGKASVVRVVKSDTEWKQQLSPVSYQVTRHAGTERA